MTHESTACSHCETPEGSLRELDGAACYLCQKCHEQLQADSAMDGVLMRTAEIMDKRPDEALLMLQRVHDEHRLHDHDGSLTRKIKSHRAFILAHHGRYAEALQELEAVPTSSFRTHEERADHARDRAQILHLHGRTREALNDLENALTNRQELHPATVLRLLTEYADVASSCGLVVPEMMGPILGQVAESLGIPGADEGSSGHPIGNRIQAMWMRFKEGGRRYENAIFLGANKPREERGRIIDEYSRTEPIGFYSELAKKMVGGEGEGDDRATGERA